MPAAKKNIAISFLGTQLDHRKYSDRWTKWRPNVALCQQHDLVIDELILIHDNHSTKLAKLVTEDIAQISPETTVTPEVINLHDPWDFEEVFGSLHSFAGRHHFDTEKQNLLIHMTTGTHVAQICLFLLAESRHLPGKLIQTSPPNRRSTHSMPQGTYQIIDLDLSKYDKLATRFAEEQAEARDFLKSGIDTKNQAFNHLIDQIELVALRSDAPILLTGPTGAGKSHLASRIFELRQQRGGLSGNFVEVNCATLRGDMAMSTLFGHKKGSFTGAASDRPGLLREAHKGLLFLDEIGELGPDEQAVLLRAIEEGKWLPVGSDTPVKSSFQLIAGTNRDLRTDVAEGRFREDLLARINLWTFQLPGLAERREDIAPNLDYELRRHREKTGNTITFNKEAQQTFLDFAKSPKSSWRGNFRDLNAAVTRMATLAPRGRIRTEEVEQECERLEQSWLRPGSEDDHLAKLSDFLPTDAIAEIDPFDRPQLAYVIETCRQCKSLSEAGRKLFSVSREKRTSTNDGDRIRKYLAKFDLSFDQLSQ
ncbi:anaerobic nitric oxide reductase transcription regulator NorR [Rubritalea halochordaticola]|uniref:Anaerobic nitric oxide reductase transcription regulator NorR n=1 Tax=Rubritalea halochordaticola TaxID=714537 RepID=A0ABP9UZB6_9BACT